MEFFYTQKIKTSNAEGHNNEKYPFLHKFLAALEIQFHTGLSLSIKYADCQSFKASVFSQYVLGCPWVRWTQSLQPRTYFFNH